MSRNCLNCNVRLNYWVERRWCAPCKEENPEFVEHEQRRWNWYGKVKNNGQARYKLYQKGATKRGLAFDLTFEQFMEFWQKTCFYCDEDISTIGLDRYINKFGYTLDNVVPCCKECNFSKRAMDGDDYIAHCMQVAANTK